MGMKLPRGPAIRALLWEDWRRSRVAFFVSLGIGMLPLVSEGVLMRMDENNLPLESDSLQMAASWGFVPFVLFGLVSLFSLGDLRELSTRIPSRHSVLPFGPARAATLHLTFRLLAMSVLACTLIVAAQGLVGIFRFHDYMAVLGVVLPIFLFVQCLAWTAGNFGVVPFLISMSTIPLGAIVFGEAIAETVDDLMFEYSPGTRFALWIGLNLFLSGIAIAGSTFGRHIGSNISISITRKSPRGILTRSAPSKPLSAHTWFEWVERGSLLPSLTLGLTTFALAYVALGVTMYPDGDRATTIAMTLTVIPLCISPATAAFAGIRVLLTDRRMMQTGLGAYVYSHPLSTREFARARLRMSLRSVLVNQLFCLVCFVAGVAGTFLIGGTTSEHLPHISASLVVKVSLLAVGHSLLVWTLYWMVLPAFALWIWYLVVTIFCAIVEFETQVVAALVILPAGILFLPALIYLIKKTVTLNLVDKRLLMRSVTVAAISFVISLWVGRDIISLLAAGFGGFTWSEVELGRSFWALLSGAAPWYQVTVLIGLISVALCPAFPILAQPLLVHRMRHR